MRGGGADDGGTGDGAGEESGDGGKIKRGGGRRGSSECNGGRGTPPDIRIFVGRLSTDAVSADAVSAGKQAAFDGRLRNPVALVGPGRDKNEEDQRFSSRREFETIKPD